MHTRMRIAHDNDKITIRRKLDTVESLMVMTKRIAPKDFLQFRFGSQNVAEPVECGVGQDEQVIPECLQVIDPGVLGKAIEFLSFLEAAIVGPFVDEDRFAGAQVETTLQIHVMAQKEFFGVSVEKLHLQGFIGQVNARHFG